MHKLIAFSCRFWRKCNFACKGPKSKIKMLIVRCTKNQKSWNLHCRTQESFPFQPWWYAIPTFDVNQCSLRGSTFCFCLLRLGLAVTGAPVEHFGTRIHGVPPAHITVQTSPALPLPSLCLHWNTSIATAVSLFTLKHRHSCHCRLPVYTETPALSLLSPCHNETHCVPCIVLPNELYM